MFDPFLAPVVIAHVAESDLVAYELQDYLFYHYKNVPFVILAVVAPIVRRSAAGAKFKKNV